jgi:photosystem II stability/assembly factor-like uncharacterized protein
MENLNSVGREFRLAVAILVIAGGVAINSSRAATWTEINTGLPSTAVDVSSIAIAPTTPSTIYARTFSANGSGGIFKTTDGAGSWRAISSVVGVNSLVVDPTNSSTIYVVAGGGILKSTNGGESWIRANAGLPDTYVNTIVIDPITPSKLYAVTGSTGIFKSTNSGGSWNTLNTGLPPNSFINTLVIGPTTPPTVYVTGSVPQPGKPPSAVLLKSTDGGESWNALDSGLPPNSNIRSLVIAPSTPSMIFAIASLNGIPPGAGILKSKDGGESWNAIDTGLPSGAAVTSVVIDPADSSTIYIAALFPFAEAGGILKSTDGGASWDAIDPGLPANTPIYSVAIDPVTPSTLYLNADGGIFKSKDGGASWHGATTGLTTIDVHVLAANGVDAATIYAAAADSVFKSGDSGASWTKLFAFQLFMSSVPGPIGLFPPFPDGAPAYPDSLLIDFTNPNILYAATFRPNGCYFADNLLFKSTDGGVSWSDSVSPDKSGCILAPILGLSSGLKAMDPTDPNTLYLAETDDEDGYYALLRSKDGGASWNAIGNFAGGLQAGVWAVTIDPTNPATLYAGLDDVPLYTDDGSVTPGLGGVFKSTDGGASWNPVGLSGGAVNLLAIDPAHPSILYAGTGSNYVAPRGFRGLFKSIDSGASWSAINSGLANLLDTGASMTTIVIDPANSNILYAGSSGGGVFKSSDGGAHWSPFNVGLANLDVRVLAVAPGSRHILYAGTAGGVFKITDDTP